MALPHQGVIRETELGTRVPGDSRDVGHGVDLVLGLEEWERLEIQLIGSAFFPGDAFGPGRDDSAAKVFLRFECSF